MDRRSIKINVSRFIITTALFGATLSYPTAHAEGSCSTFKKGPITFDVDVCKDFDPAIFDPAKPKYKIIGDLDPEGRQQLLDSYRGLLTKGTVVLSEAIEDGISLRKGVLQGEKVFLFVPSGAAKCEEVRQKRITGILAEKCCNGTADAPCLLGSGLTLTDIKVVGPARVGDNITQKPKKPHSKDYIEAERKYAAKKYKEAVVLYQKAEDGGDIDVKGLFRMGNALREIEKCDLAIRPLKKIWELRQANKVYTDEEIDARRGIFLLARCHAKNGDASGAVFYLNAFLLDPKKYRSELQQSLKHKDFGWIHTSKDYQQYKRDAQRKLGS